MGLQEVDTIRDDERLEKLADGEMKKQSSDNARI